MKSGIETEVSFSVFPFCFAVQTNLVTVNLEMPHMVCRPVPVAYGVVI
jgi:hypothetical protein